MYRGEIQRLNPRDPLEVREREKNQLIETENVWSVREEGNQECRILEAK